MFAILIRRIHQSRILSSNTPTFLFWQCCKVEYPKKPKPCRGPGDSQFGYFQKQRNRGNLETQFPGAHAQFVKNTLSLGSPTLSRKGARWPECWFIGCKIPLREVFTSSIYARLHPFDSLIPLRHFGRSGKNNGRVGVTMRVLFS